MISGSFADANVFDILLGKADPMQPLEVTNESLSNKFLAPENRGMDYDFRNIDGIYRKYPPALQLPVGVLSTLEKVHRRERRKRSGWEVRGRSAAGHFASGRLCCGVRVGNAQEGSAEFA